MKRRNFLLAAAAVSFFLVFVLSSARADKAARYVWWEGEKTVKTNFPDRSWFSASTFPDRKDELSGGRWLSNSGKRTGPEAFAMYSITVPETAEYDFWARKFWKHGPFKWRFGKGDWRTCGRDVALADSVELKKHTCVNWVHLGSLKLKKGKTSFELRLLAGPGEDLTAAFDCFLLTPDPFVPAGKRKPGEKSGKTEPGYFAWEPGVDSFEDDAVLDLRYLNEKEAGQSGFVKKKGDDFALGNGEKVRFWAVNVGPNIIDQQRSAIDYMARRLAKLGVNAVRFHGPVFASGDDPAKIDEKRLDNMHYMVHALKKQGIYSMLSFYFPLWFDIQPGYGIEGYENTSNKKPFTLLFFEPRMQEIYRSWAKALLTTKNPYTGKKLAEDPAVAIVEIQNEDSLFFWTFSDDNVPEPQMKKLETLFGKWAAARYGNLKKAFAAWNAPHGRDDAASGRAGLLTAWFMTREGVAKSLDKKTRIKDQVRFLAELQRKFYKDITNLFKKKFGYKGLVSAGNWKTADALMLDAVERWTYAAGDVMDRHGYVGGPHSGEGASWSVRKGHTYEDMPAVKFPWRVPVQEVLVDGYPQIISELGWPNPNRFRAESTLVTSAWASLQGIDGVFLFCVNNPYLSDTAMNKFTATSPVTAGAFPAAALAYRRFDIEEAEVVFHEKIGEKELFDLKPEAAASAEAFDELRKKGVPEGRKTANLSSGFDPLAFFAGKVARSYEKGRGRVKAAKLSKYVDRAKKIVKSETSQLEWNYGDGLVTLNAPACRAAAGFLEKAGRIELGGVSIECENEYASVMIISLDGEKLENSKKILVQVLTEEKPYGFKTEDGRIIDLGGAPFQVKLIKLEVTLPVGGTVRVRELDQNGYARKTGKMKVRGGRLKLDVAEDAVYTVIEK